jgi:hypothetical protein
MKALRLEALALTVALAACGSAGELGGQGAAGGGGSAPRPDGGVAGTTGGQAGTGGTSSGGAAGAPPVDAGPVSDGPPLYVEMGFGPSPFRPLADGDAVPVVPGNQGLPMVVFAIRASGFEFGDYTMPTLRDPVLITACVNVMTGLEVGSGRMQQGMHPRDDGMFEFSDGWTPFFSQETAFRGQRLRCTATLIDANNRRKSDVREIIAR